MENNDDGKFDHDDHWFPWKDVVACRKNDIGYKGEHDQTPPESRTKTCPRCGGPVERFYFKSPAWTWENLCGRAGWMEACFACKKQISFDLDLMN